MDKNNIMRTAAAAIFASAAIAATAQPASRPEAAQTHQGLMPAMRLNMSKAVGANLPRRAKAKAELKAADPKLFEGRTFCGAMINSTDWNGAYITNVPYGIYSYTIGSGESAKPLITSLSYNFVSAAWNGDNLYGVMPMLVMGAMNGARYITIDTHNWKETKNVPYDASSKTYSLLPSAMAFDPTSGKTYSMQYNDGLSGLDWCVLDRDNDAFVKLAKFRGLYNVMTLAAMPDGTMYFINGYGDLYTVDKQTARPALVGATGITPASYAQSMTYDNRTGLFLWAAVTGQSTALYAVDPKTAETTLVANLDKNEEFAAIYDTIPSAKDAAPAIVNDLALNFNVQGGSAATISFTVPQQTYKGSQLGNVKLNLWLDGQNLKGTEAKPGDKVELPVELAEGNHYIAVNTSNAEGWSPMASMKRYAGYDTPDTVGNVRFAYDAEKKQNTVTWNSPRRGINDGFVDKANLRYNVLRMPDSVYVAQNIADTAFTEPTPEAMHKYSYRVAAVNNGKQSAWNESEARLSGDAFTVPYIQSFAEQGAFADFFTVIDGNNDGNVWRDGGNGIARFDLTSTAKEGDDWLISPVIDMKKGKLYEFAMDMKTFTRGYGENFEILVGTNPKDTTTFKMVAKEDSFELYEDFAKYAAEFKVDADGKYYVAVRYLGNEKSNSTMLLIRSIAVNLIGDEKAPEGVSGLSVEASDADKMEAVVSFKAPETDLANNKLTKISSIKVYRDDAAEPLTTFDAPQPGAALTYTDSNVRSVGINTYRVVAANEHGDGRTVADSAFVGTYAAPYVENFNTISAAHLYKTAITGVDLVANPFYGWEYDKDNKKMKFYAYLMSDETPIDLWLYSPAIKLDANSVYELSYLATAAAYTKTVTNKVSFGTDTVPEAQVNDLGDMQETQSYSATLEHKQVVTAEAGKYYFGFHNRGTAAYDYLSGDLDSLSVVYLKSALSPYKATGLELASDPTGLPRVSVKFNAPKIDYQGNALAENLTIQVFNGNNPTPVYSQSNVVPGAQVEWTDENAKQGYNAYKVVAINTHGTGEMVTDTVYAGLDRPSAVANLNAAGTKDNMQAVVSWQSPAKGTHGGVLVASDITYNVYSYDPTDQTFALIQKGVKGNTLTVSPDRQPKAQQQYYYAVTANNARGEGDTVAVSVVLGPLYTLPYKESFAGKQPSTEPWQMVSQYSQAFQWGFDNPNGSTYNKAVPQDNDGGCAYMYNGSQYDTYVGAGLISPKVQMNGSNSVLKFWVYNMKTNYPDRRPRLYVYVRGNDASTDSVAMYEVAGDEEIGWKEYQIDLGAYSADNFVSFAFYGYTNGYKDVIYLDNISIENGSATGIGNTSEGVRRIVKTTWHDTLGRAVGNPSHGIFIRTDVFEDGSKESSKVVLK